MSKRPPIVKSNENNRVDEEFTRIIAEIQKRSIRFSRPEKIRIDQWCKKLTQVSVNDQSKKHRNIYALLLLDCVLKDTLQEPFINSPPEEYLHLLDKHSLKGKIETIKHELNRRDILITEHYRSPIKEQPTNRLASVSKPPLQSTKGVRKTFSHSQVGARHQDQYFQAISHSLNSYESPRGKQTASTWKSSSRERQDKVLYPKSQNSFSFLYSKEEEAGIREIRKKQARLDIAKSSIETLKEELNARLNTVSELNREFEIASEKLKKTDQEKDMIFNFLQKFKGKLKDGSIRFGDKSTEEDLDRKANEILTALSEFLKIKNNKKDWNPVSKCYSGSGEEFEFRNNTHGSSIKVKTYNSKRSSKTPFSAESQDEIESNKLNGELSFGYRNLSSRE